MHLTILKKLHLKDWYPQNVNSVDYAPCPNEIPIPEILRLRNISIGYGQYEFAKERYNLIGRAGHWWEEKILHFVEIVIMCSKMS